MGMIKTTDTHPGVVVETETIDTDKVETPDEHTSEGSEEREHAQASDTAVPQDQQ